MRENKVSEKKQKVVCPSGEELVKLRKRVGLNQSDFWKRVGVTQSGGSRYETGRAMPKPVQILVQVAYGSQSDAGKLFAALRSKSVSA